MIGTDIVSISTAGSDGFVKALSDGSLAVNTGAELVIPFSHFDGGFTIGSGGTLFSSDKATGDRWDLA